MLVPVSASLFLLSHSSGCNKSLNMVLLDIRTSFKLVWQMVDDVCNVIFSFSFFFFLFSDVVFVKSLICYGKVSVGTSHLHEVPTTGCSFCPSFSFQLCVVWMLLLLAASAHRCPVTISFNTHLLPSSYMAAKCPRCVSLLTPLNSQTSLCRGYWFFFPPFFLICQTDPCPESIWSLFCGLRSALSWPVLSQEYAYSFMNSSAVMTFRGVSLMLVLCWPIPTQQNPQTLIFRHGFSLIVLQEYMYKRWRVFCAVFLKVSNYLDIWKKQPQQISEKCCLSLIHLISSYYLKNTQWVNVS